RAPSAASVFPDTTLFRSQVGQIGRVVAGVEEGVLLQADVDERRLHARQDVRHDTLVDAPHDRAVPMPLEVQLGEEITLLDSDSRSEEHTSELQSPDHLVS